MQTAAPIRRTQRRGVCSSTLCGATLELAPLLRAVVEIAACDDQTAFVVPRRLAARWAG
ncbi:DUF6207 family protein [Streptomyces sp. NPDC060006]|uniref:DUF6207 family protein n=1 Tax=Streptomyces sp. NPDC060006 TaxID=3347035 RepID=UPI00368AB53C